MSQGAAPRSPQRSRGFTLIELMAVVAIFALFLAFVAPNLNTLSGRYLAQQASRLQGALEYARESAVVSARPHHVVLDLDVGAYHIASEEPPPELAGAAPSGGAGAPGAAPEAEPQDEPEGGKLSLAPPARARRERAPVSGPLGQWTQLLEEVYFAGVETEEGWTESGRVELAFEADGVARPTLIVLEHQSGSQRGLEVLPLSEAVRVLDDEELARR